MNITTFNTDQEAVEELARRIRNLRLNDPGRRMSQQDLADKAGIARSTVARFEQKGEISLMSLIAIMRVMKLFDNLNLVAPEKVPLSPIAIAKEGVKKRQRVRSK